MVVLDESLSLAGPLPADPPLSLFVLRPPSEVGPVPSAPGVTLRHTPLELEDGRRLDAYDIVPHRRGAIAAADALEALLASAAHAGAPLAFVLFEGVFLDAARQFSSEWHRDRTVALLVPPGAPRLALTLADRRSPEWQALCAEARRGLSS